MFLGDGDWYASGKLKDIDQISGWLPTDPLCGADFRRFIDGSVTVYGYGLHRNDQTVLVFFIYDNTFIPNSFPFIKDPE